MGGAVGGRGNPRVELGKANPRAFIEMSPPLGVLKTVLAVRYLEIENQEISDIQSRQGHV